MWNVVKEGLKIKLKLANPFQIDSKYCSLIKNNESVNALFMQKQQVNRNTFLIRFALPDPQKCLGLMIGQFVRVILENGKQRPYNPISRIDEPGMVDFLVRDLRKQNGTQSFTNTILSLQEGQKITIKGPFTQYLYYGYGKLEWANQPLKTYKHIGIITFQSAITGVYTLIDSLASNYDNTAISLLWVGQEYDDFIFIEEYSTLAEQLRLNCNLMLRQLRPGWVGPFGPITKTHIKSYMPPVGDDTAILLVGGPKQIDYLVPLLNQLGYLNIMTPIQS